MAKNGDGYGIVYRDIMRDKRLTPEAKAIYAYLCSFAGNGCTCFPSVEMMCAELCMTEARLRKHMKQLITAGIVKKERRRNGNIYGGNLYTLARAVETRAVETRAVEIQRVENVGTNSNSLNSNSLNNNSLNSNNTNSAEALAAYVCDLLNQARAKASKTARLKPNVDMIQELIDEGVTIQEIREAAQDCAKKGGAGNWYYFLEYCEYRFRK